MEKCIMVSKGGKIMCEICLRGTVGWKPENLKFPTHCIKILNSGHYEVYPLSYNYVEAK